MEYSCSIVIPVHNSLESLSVLCDEITKMLGDDIEIIMVDDGSEESTWAMIKTIKEKLGTKVKGIRLSRNFGQHNATICGLNYCTKELVVTIDDDLQYSPKDIAVMMNTLIRGSFEVVYGLPLVKRQGPIRVLGDKLVYYSFLLFKEKITKASSFRLINRDIVDQIKNYKHYFVNVDAIIRWYTARMGYCFVTHQKRSESNSGYSTIGLVSIMSRAIIAYSALPLKLFLFFFITASMLGILTATFYFCYGYIFNGLLLTAAFSFALLAILGGAMLFAYLYHITANISNKPCYHVIEKI